MTFYQKEIERIRKICYSNERQLEAVIKTRNYINNNLHEEINLILLSNIGFASKFHLLRLFKKYYGQTPKQYLIDKRIEKSKAYLAEGLTVTETCFAVGFECPSSFSTLFKSKNGISPIEFQKKQFSQSRPATRFRDLPIKQQQNENKSNQHSCAGPGKSATVLH